VRAKKKDNIYKEEIREKRRKRLDKGEEDNSCVGLHDINMNSLSKDNTERRKMK
jgi:hypothetical protein